MNKQIKVTILVIGSITIIASIYAYFNNKGVEALSGVVIGLSLVVTAFLNKKTKGKTKEKE